MAEIPKSGDAIPDFRLANNQARCFRFPSEAWGAKWKRWSETPHESRADVTPFLSKASLNKADLSRAVLERANFSHATLRGTNLSGVDLRGVLHLVQGQLAEAYGDETTVLRDDSTIQRLSAE
jgi:uncharacterized protein YjbI with pentapeptide repeats